MVFNIMTYGLFFSSSPITVEFIKLTELELAQQDKWIKQADEWATKNWQYIFPTIADWEADIRKFKEELYLQYMRIPTI